MASKANKIKLKALVAYEKQVQGGNALNLLKKQEKSATDVLHLAFILLYNEGKVKTVAEMDDVDSDIIEEALNSFNVTDDTEQKAE